MYRDSQDQRGHGTDPRRGARGGELELYALRKDGTEFPAEIRLGPVRGRQGRLVIHAVRDVSRRKRRESELEDNRVKLEANQRRLRALAAQLMLVEESERREIARGLHDDVGQTLLAAKMGLDELLEDGLPADRVASARDLPRLLDHAIRTTRTLTFDLASAVLYEVGLGAALQGVCERAEEQSGIRFHPPTSSSESPIPETMRIVLYRTGRELIRNVLKHSGARTARVSLSSSDNRIKLTVEDDGRGFDAAPKLEDSGLLSGFGLFSIVQHLDQIGGRLEVASSPGSGTRAVALVSLDAKEGNHDHTDPAG